MKEVLNVRKDSVATSASSMTTATLSPTKTASSMPPTPSLRDANPNLHLRLVPQNEDGGAILKENGNLDDKRSRDPGNTVVHPKINSGLSKSIVLKNTSQELRTN